MAAPAIIQRYGSPRLSSSVAAALLLSSINPAAALTLTSSTAADEGLEKDPSQKNHRWLLERVDAAEAVDQNSGSGSGSGSNTSNNSIGVIKVEFFGEAQCPFCRKFVQDAWPTVWEDAELMEHVDYDFVAWGNAYFSTAKCSSPNDSSSSPYDAQERACWYEECIAKKIMSSNGSSNTNNSNNKRLGRSPIDDTDDDCFSGRVIYQHSEKEGMVDIYENCVKFHYGLETAVDFTYCCEGPNMDDPTLSTAHDLLVQCANNNNNIIIDVDLIQDCYETHGHDVEVWAAQHTPSHPGVPYVLVDGEALDDPLSIQKAICDRLSESLSLSSSFRLPKACSTARTAKDYEEVTDPDIVVSSSRIE